MELTVLGARHSRRLALLRDHGAILAAFTATLFLSAVLLFSVQPMFAKMALPRLGGSPSVWAVSMCFFQAALLAGYCYAHVLNRYLTSRLAPLVHLTLCGLAVLALPIGLPSGWAEPPAGDAYIWLIAVLAIGVGLPFLAVSANAPLLQSWFARTGHPHANDPYFLYGASNLGSLVALIAYPLVIEPSAGLVMQGRMWATGFVLLGLCIAACGLMLVARNPVSDALVTTATATKEASPLTWTQRATWIGLAAVPSGLLVAFTSYVTTDVASAPFLWVIPLAIFLATFIVVFRPTPLISHRLMLLLQPALVIAVLFGLATAGELGWTIGCFGGLAAFVVTTLVCHRELFERRPHASHLTEFYLWMSLGGVVGGVFAALIAPQIFSTLWEYPLLLVLGMACRPGLAARLGDREIRCLAYGAVAALMLIALTKAMMAAGVLAPSKAVLTLLIGSAGVFAMISSGRTLSQLTCTVLALVAVWMLPSALNRGDTERSFFGIHRVTLTGDGQMRVLMHGTTIHGAERIKDGAGNPVTAAPAATYYYAGGPMAQGVLAARQASGKPDGGLRVGIVGLGAGSLACASRADEAWRFYEIDPLVVKIARDPSRFSFLSRCRPKADVALGDARLTLAKEPDGTFDYLLIDAFSSDAVPVHLMTVEALRLYLDKLAPLGLLAMHVSNRHLDLVSVTGALAGAIPGIHAALADDRVPDKSLDRASSHVVFIAKSPAALAAMMSRPFMGPLPASAMRPWTDDYSDILKALLHKYVP